MFHSTHSWLAFSLVLPLVLSACSHEREPEPQVEVMGDAGSPSPRDSGMACCSPQLDATVIDPDGAPPGVPDAAMPGPDAAPDPFVVRVTSGELQGTQVGAVRAFLGIPYAKPPLGALRLAPPEPALPWSGTRTANAFGPICTQPATPDALAMSEDCLTLNVYTPEATDGDAVPVMVFFYGGGFGAGGSSQYPSELLSEAANAVIVTVNYRVGPLGFMALTALDGALPSGNFGLRDQQLALRWVRDNIDAFHGDPANVTAFGESAGALSACLHLFASGSEGLVQRVILESGSCIAGPFVPRTREQALSASATLAANVCPLAADMADCLRALPASAFVPASAAAAADFSDSAGLPHLDGQLLTEPLLERARAGRFQHVPILLGSNAREASLYETRGAPLVADRIGMSIMMLAIFPNEANALLAHYLPDNDADAHEAFIRALTDHQFRCPTRLLARAASAAQVPTYLYSFEVQPAAHSQELDYVFGWPCCGVSKDLPGAPYPTLKPTIKTVQDYWGAFAATGDPNHVGEPSWPRYTESTDAHMVLAAAASANSQLEKQDCDWWDSVFAVAP